MSSVALIGTPLRLRSSVASPKARRTLVVRASAQADRRKVLRGIATGLAFIPATAVIADEQRTQLFERQQQQQEIGRRGEQQQESGRRGGQIEQRTSFSDMRTRVQDSRRALKDLRARLEGSNWDESRNQIRKQTSSLRQDLDNLAQQASNRNAAQQKKNDFFAQVDRLDQAIKDKNRDQALSAHNRVLNTLDRVMGEVGAA